MAAARERPARVAGNGKERTHNMNKTGIVRDHRFMNHQMGPYHPESPRRLEVIYDMLEEPDMRGNFRDVPVREAKRDELLRVHSTDYVETLAHTQGKEYTYLDPDTQTSSGSYEAALLAAGGLCEAISMVVSGALDNAFALVRPPGHHAERNCAMGFCLFNNVAVGARYAQASLNLKKILVIDWDLHHGNGTQHSFEEDPSILYFSTHQYPYYPGSGAFQQVGRGRGEGFTVNIPLSVGCGDGEYVAIFERILNPIAREFGPELVLVSAGFDIYQGDPLGGMEVTPRGFAALMRTILDAAATVCGGKVVVTLEGGYDLKGLRDSVKAVLMELAGLSETSKEEFMALARPNRLDPVLHRAIQIQGSFWKALKP
jgi:acetoin utilization deacetylase AcuC-like enzyme